MEPSRERESIRKKVKRLAPLFERYGRSLSDLDATLKWKSLVLVLGNFSSGKSTLINELTGCSIQRTGQSPTDDSFTVITRPDPGREPVETTGASLVADDSLPFSGFRACGENFISHFRMLTVDCDLPDDLAIIDTPGMLDAVTEKDRGYAYDRVIGEFARLADLIVLMFDPHKAGTIREVYRTIRDTLPENVSEDRIVFVMSRIDECDNLGDLVRSYGTLCWNLSQMTGRKDIPRIFMTYAPALARNDTPGLSEWLAEREELKQKILSAPALRFSHMLEHIEKQVGDLAMTVEAVETFTRRARKLLGQTLRVCAVLAASLFLFGDIVLRAFTGWPDPPLLSAVLNGRAGAASLIAPTALAVLPFVFGIFWFNRFGFNSVKKRLAEDPDALVRTDSQFRQSQWQRLCGTTLDHINDLKVKEIFAAHGRNRQRLDRFIEREIRPLYRK